MTGDAPDGAWEAAGGATRPRRNRDYSWRTRNGGDDNAYGIGRALGALPGPLGLIGLIVGLILDAVLHRHEIDAQVRRDHEPPLNLG